MSANVVDFANFALSIVAMCKEIAKFYTKVQRCVLASKFCVGN